MNITIHYAKWDKPSQLQSVALGKQKSESQCDMTKKINKNENHLVSSQMFQELTLLKSTQWVVPAIPETIKKDNISSTYSESPTLWVSSRESNRTFQESPQWEARALKTLKRNKTKQKVNEMMKQP